MSKKSLESRATKSSQAFALRSTASAAVILGHLIAGGNAFAQTAPPADPSVLDTVVITGARKSAESAQIIKMKSDQVVDSIVAEDIGKFPDKNVAEILGRVTGVQILRGSGEAGTVLVRGLGGVVTLLNGREFFSDSGRSLYLADVPATMLQRVDVFKTQGADLPEGGTAGVVDVRTNRPFDFKAPQLFVTGRAENRDKAKRTNPDLSTMASNRWKTDLGEFGALAGLSYQRGRYHDETGFVGTPLVYNQADVKVGNPGITSDVVGTDQIGRVLTLGDRKRVAGNFALQWRPNTDLEFFLEGFHTKIDHDFQTSFLVGGVPYWGLSNTVITTKPGTNKLDTITNTNYDGWGFVSTQAKRDQLANSQFALGGQWDATQQLRVTSEIARTIAHADTQNMIMDLNYVPRNTMAAVRSGGGFIDYPGLNMTDPNNFRLAGGVDVQGRRNGTSTDWRADAIYEPARSGFFKELSTGVRLAERRADSIGTNQLWQNAGPNIGKVASSLTPGLTSLSEETSGDFGVKQYVLPDRNWILNNSAAFRKLLTGSEALTPFDPLTLFDDVEKTSALYGKTKFGFDWGGVPISGIAGLRVVRTQQTLKGNSATDGVVAPVNIDTSRTDTLPSLALKANLTSQLIARLVAGKAIERAPFADYNPGLVLFSPGGGVTFGSGTAGNPNLKPTESTNVDVALEWYFARTGSLTGTVFDHKFKNRVLRSTNEETYGKFQYQVSRPYNLNQANLKGAELSYRQFYDFLPGWLSGFGLEANFTYMTGDQTDEKGMTTDFVGQSKTAYNLVALYEKNAFYGRLAYNWRSKFLSETKYRATDRNLYVAALKTLDASFGYNVSKQLTVSLDMTNLLNQAYHDYFDKDPSLVRDVRYFDRSVALSLRWKL